MKQIVNSTQLSRWFSSASRDAQELLPHLIRRLVLCTAPLDALQMVGIAAGDDIRRRGYDGQIHFVATHPFIPAGVSVWEMGTGDPEKKFDRDFGNRSKSPGSVNISETTFIFVTPHSWEGKARAEANAKAEKKWKDVRIFDSSDLETWLESAPAVARWLADSMGIPVSGLDDTGTYTRVFAAKYGFAFLPDLVVGGRNDALNALIEWMHGDKPQLTLEVESPEEAAIFVCAMLEKLPPDERDRAKASTIIAYEAGAVDYLAGAATGLIVLPVGIEATRRAKARASQNFRVVSSAERRVEGRASSEDRMRPGVVRRQAVRDSLMQAGLTETRADRIARECKGSLTAALMMLAAGPDEPLPWTTGVSARRLAPLVLAGQWQQNNDKDRAALAKLANISEKELEDVLASWSAPIGPLIQRGVICDWLAWDFAWRALAPVFDEALWKRFESVIDEALLTPDPQLELDPKDRWLAYIHGKQHPYSHALRSGLIGSIVQFGLNDGHEGVDNGQARADYLVRRLLSGDRSKISTIWFTLATFLSDLAEAAPNAFLDAADTVAADQDAIAVLFAEGDGFTSFNPHTFLLWALERLAWSPTYLGRASVILAKLAAIDPGGKLQNRPAHTLREIFIPWNPSTLASVAERLNAIEAVNAAQSAVAWRLALSLMPQSHDVASPTAKPRWRSWLPPSLPSPSIADYWSFIEQLVRRMLVWAGNVPARHIDLLSIYDDLWKGHPELAKEVFAAIAAQSIETWRDAEKVLFTDKSRELLARHRDYADTDWAIPEEALRPLDELQKRTKPESVVAQISWLFDHAASRYSPNYSFEESERKLWEARNAAVKDVLDSHGLPGVFELAGKVEQPSSVGVCLARLNRPPESETQFFQRFVATSGEGDSQPQALALVQGYVAVAFATGGLTWLQQLKANSEIKWSATALTNLAIVLPARGDVWDEIDRWGKDIAKSYWKKLPLQWLQNPDADLDRAIQCLMEAERFYRAIDLLGMISHHYTGDKKLPVDSDLVVRLLTEAVKYNPKDEPAGVGMLSHHLSQILDRLEAQGVTQNVLATLEWAYLPALKYTARRAKSLEAVLLDDPEFFVHLLKLAFKARNEPPREVSDAERAAGLNAHELFREIKRVPGQAMLPPITSSEGDITFPAGPVDANKLLSWIDDARQKAKDCDRLEVADSTIGNIFAYAPTGTDGAWPCEPVRDAIENVASAELERGLAVGVFNKRGVHFVEPGGKQETRLSQNFRGYADLIRSKWPRTGQVLDRIATGYEQEAAGNIKREQFEEFE